MALCITMPPRHRVWTRTMGMWVVLASGTEVMGRLWWWARGANAAPPLLECDVKR